MKKGLFEKRIPTFLALLFLLIGLSATLLLVQNGVFIISRASPNQEPQDIKVVNITNNSFTVTFTTLDQTTAGVSLEGNNSNVFFDDRDKSGVKGFSSHFITVSNLSPGTKYSFSVLSNGKAYLKEGNKFEATTATTSFEEDTDKTITGSILLPDGTPGADTLVFAKIKDSQSIAVVTNDRGDYSLPLYQLSDSTNQPYIINPMDDVEISATHGSLSSKVTYSFQKGGKVPLITLSSDYSFIASVEEEEVGTPSSNLKLPDISKSTNKIRITVPKKNETFVDQKPQFKGTALPNSIVKITIHSPSPIQITIRTDPNGNWSYRPAVSLEVGPHTITIDTVDATGSLVSITSDFIIFASGSQIAENATPSASPTVALPTATLTPTYTPTPTTIASTITPTVTTASPTTSPTVNPTISTTITPTVTQATETPTLTQTLTPSPTVVAVVPPKSQPPASGDMTHTIFLTTVSILFIVAGSTLFFIL